MSVSCFIRKNTPELQEKLEAMGFIRHHHFKYGGHYLVIAGKKEYLQMDDYVLAKQTRGIDCGENEALFLVLAGMREDTDLGQWFTNGFQMAKCPATEWHSYVCWAGGDIRQYHRATPQEIVEYHKGKER